jgi:hypothetical protein
VHRHEVRCQGIPHAFESRIRDPLRAFPDGGIVKVVFHAHCDRNGTMEAILVSEQCGFLPDLDGFPPFAYLYQLLRRCARLAKRGFCFGSDMGTLVQSCLTRRDLHGERQAGRHPTILAVRFGKMLVNLKAR